MAMTLRLTDDEAQALRKRAELEGRSMQTVVRRALRKYIEDTSRDDLLDAVLMKTSLGTPKHLTGLAGDLPVFERAIAYCRTHTRRRLHGSRCRTLRFCGCTATSNSFRSRCLSIAGHKSGSITHR